MKYYSQLPWLSIGSLHVGSEVAEDVGRCSGTGVRLVDGECLPDGFLEVSTRRKVCSISGAEDLHTDGTSCVFSTARICEESGGSPIAGSMCDLSGAMYAALGGAEMEAAIMSGQVSLEHKESSIDITGVSECPVFPVADPMSAHINTSFRDGTCVLSIQPIDLMQEVFPSCKPTGDGTCAVPIGDMLLALNGAPTVVD